MMNQTIALFRFLMLGILNRRLFGLVGVLLLLAVLACLSLPVECVDDVIEFVEYVKLFRLPPPIYLRLAAEAALVAPPLRCFSRCLAKLKSASKSDDISLANVSSSSDACSPSMSTMIICALLGRR